MEKVLLISFMAMTFLVPFYCMAAEPGCGYTDTETGFGGENAKLILNVKEMQSDRWMHQADILIEFLDWENPGRDRIRYFAASTARPIPRNDPNEMVKVQHISVRLYNWAMDVTKQCDNCYSKGTTVILDPGENRPWYANSVHVMINNGTTIRIPLSISR